MSLIKCDNCGRPKMGFYPRRAVVRQKMSPYRFCSPQCQAAHWRWRRREARRRALGPLYCRLCGAQMQREMRPGRPRCYCSPEHAQAAANKRRPPGSPAIAALEDASRRAERAAQQAWTAVAAANEKATAARLKVAPARQARLQEETAKVRYQVGIDHASVAQQAVSAALALVDQLYAAYRQVKVAGPDDRRFREDKFYEVSEVALADPLAKLEFEAREAALAIAPVKAAAAAANEDAELARTALLTAKRRLARRAKAARIRRAIGAGREPEELEEL